MKLSITNFFKKYEKLVFKIANSKRTMANYHMDLDDLISAGKEGLLDAYQKLDSTKSAKEEVAYVARRISGSIVDAIRQSNDLSRNSYLFNKEVSLTIDSLRALNGKDPSEKEIAAALNIDLKSYQDKKAGAQKVSFTSSNEEGESAYDNCGEIQDNQLAIGLNSNEYRLYLVRVKEIMELCVGQLDDIMQKLYQYVYCDNLKLKDIGEKLNLTESRISQLNGKLGNILENYLKESLAV